MVRRIKPEYDIAEEEIDLAVEVVVDSDGRRIDQRYIDEIMVHANEVFERTSGRPSLTGKPEHSPQVTFRITPEMKARAEQLAAARGTTISRIAREAFEQYLAS